MASPKREYPILLVADADAWADWLADHHASAAGVWLRLAKKGAPLASVTYAGALDVALCYGWIDGQKKSYDDTSWLQKFTPRGPKSLWSKVNREKAEAFIADGRMRPAGLAAVEAARRNGLWERAYDSSRRATVPDDLQAALDAHPKARAFFGTLSGANRYAILWRVQTAVRAETRARRIAGFIAMLERHETVH
jgi:uncharacterized protein YdeI (YjbR/CyaY-like superfamily)